MSVELSYGCSNDDLAFLHAVETAVFPVKAFDHRAHLRLAYVYLVEQEIDAAVEAMRAALLGLLEKAGIDPAQKFHETLTRSWLLAVRHFMDRGPAADCADQFIDQHPQLLDSRIMLSHYSAERLFSDQARRDFLEPDLEAIPAPLTRQG